MSELPYMPLWIEPLLADTEHLTNAEFGAYMRLLCAMWRLGGSVPDDDKLLRRLIHADPRNWPALRDMLAQFVIREGGRITQKRLKEIRTQQHAKREHTVDAAKQRWHKAGKSLKQNGVVDAPAHASAPTPARARALAQEPEPEEPSSPKGDDGSGPPLPPGTTSPARPPAVMASRLTGPFVPAGSARTNDWERPPAPGPKSEFLRAYEKAQAGDSSDLDQLKAKRASMPINSTIVPVVAQPQEDDHERRSDDGPDDDDIDSLIRF